MFPIFEDYLDQEKYQNLRKYLYPKHIEIAKKLNLKEIINSEDVNQEIQKENLVSLENSEIRKYYFFYNVSKEKRYIRKNVYKMLVKLGEKFQEKIHYKNSMIKVKIAISSAIRTKQHQEKLRNFNWNAVENSTHSYGISIDIFYDEFYISLDNLCESKRFQYCKKFLEYHGFVLGGNLRRQLQSILAETLIELQKENLLYVILEKNQRVFHITFLPTNR